MRVTIINVDNAVGINGEFKTNLDLSDCGLPVNFWAFQWNQNGDEIGEIEYNSPMIQNDLVTEIPPWANACIAVWQAKIDQEAAEKAAIISAQNESQS